MALTQPDLTISATLVDCSGLTFSDDTGEYDATTNPLGYGVPNGPGLDDVTDVTLTLRYSRLSTDLVFAFEVTSQVITAATLSLGGATAVDILSELTSTAWPLEDFDLTADYGVTIPDFSDDVYKITYQIEGEADDSGTPTAFDYTTILWKPVSCNLSDGVDNLWAAVDPKQGCTDCIKKVMYAEANLRTFEIAGEVGDLTMALNSLEEGERYLEDNCADC